MNFIFHITPRSHWQQAQQTGDYQAASLSGEGFIHCSTAVQVAGSANKFFRGQSDLVLLWIDPARLKSELRYEAIATGEQFPHLYGPLNLDAIVRVTPLTSSTDGTFITPEELDLIKEPGF